MSQRTAYLYAACLLIIAVAPGTGLASGAAGVRYALYPMPNYDRGARSANTLMDGRYARGLFWTSGETLGWERARLIRIDIELAQRFALERFCIRTARGEYAGVRLPRRLDIFGSVDKRTYAYLGSIAPDRVHRRGDYKVMQLCEPLASSGVQYLSLFVEPDGGFFFTDEVEFLGTAAPGAALRAGPVIDAAALAERRDRIVASVNSCARSEQYDVAFRDSLPAASRQLAGAELPPLSCRQEIALQADTKDRLQQRQEQLHALRQRLLAQLWGETLVVEMRDPWVNTLDTQMPHPTAGTKRLDILAAGHAALLLSITNTSHRTVSVSVKTTPDDITVRWFDARAAQADDGEVVVDALMPLGRESIEVGAGASRQLWMDVRAPDVIGRQTLRAMVSSADFARPVDVEVPVELNIAAPVVDSAVLPAATVWAYSTDRLIHDRWSQALIDLRDHNVNVAVLHPADLPWPLTANSDSRARMHFRRRLAEVRDNRYVLLYLGLNVQSWRDRSNATAPFHSDAWLNAYAQWLRERLEDIAASDVNPSNVLVYPIDEPRDAADRSALAAIAQVTHRNRIAVFATIDQPGTAKLSAAARWLSVVQLRADRTTQVDVAAWQAQGKQVWLYQPEGGGKAADPLEFYRFAAWRAFDRGADGVGFWAYADIGMEGDVWNDRDGERPDFAVIYREGDSLGSSRRWEAWRLGLEDFGLLRAAADHAPNPAAVRELAREMLMTKPTAGAFDAARRTLLDIIARPRADAAPSREK